MLRRIVRAGHHDAAVDVQGIGGEVEHRRRSPADVEHREAAVDQALGHRVGQLGRGDPTVIAKRHLRAAVAGQDGAEGPAEMVGVLRAQRLADDAADIVLAQDRRIEIVASRHSAPSAMRACARSACTSAGEMPRPTQV